MFVTVNAVIAAELNVSYPAAAALTGVPYIFGGVAALKAHVISRFLGKRGLYLVSATTVLLAMVWNMHIIASYPTFMISRILQGLGWGTFEALVAGSISDMFFVCISGPPLLNFWLTCKGASTKDPNEHRQRRDNTIDLGFPYPWWISVPKYSRLQESSYGHQHHASVLHRVPHFHHSRDDLRPLACPSRPSSIQPRRLILQKLPLNTPYHDPPQHEAFHS
jgi:hypothetical protein